MKSAEFVKRIRNYSIASFLVPLIAINSCLLFYKYVGDMNNLSTFPNTNWNIDEQTYTQKEYQQLVDNVESYTFTNCPKYKFLTTYTTFDNPNIVRQWKRAKGTADTICDFICGLLASNKIKSITVRKGKNLNYTCIKNYQNSYLLIKKFTLFEAIIIHSIKTNPIGFAKIKNPYLYGEVSISRTARFFPSTLIFKPLIILTSFLLILYWKSNLNFFNELKNKKTLVQFSKKFFYFGVLSCLFLILHATFLGLDFDSKLFTKMRRLIIILFIFFEIFAQILLTMNLFKLKEELKKYINPLMLKIKIIFVTTAFFATCIAFSILVFGNSSAAFKHILEWNYFTFLLIYYLLSRLLWKFHKPRSHTRKGA